MAFLKDETLEFLNIENSLGINYAYTFYKMALEQKEDVESMGEFDAAAAVKDIETKKGATRKIRHEKQSKKRGKKFKRTKKPLDQRAISDHPIGRNPVQMLVDYDLKQKQIEFKRNFYTCKICFLDKLGDHCTQFVPCFHVFCKECILSYLEIRIKDGNVKNIRCPEEKCLSEATPGQASSQTNGTKDF